MPGANEEPDDKTAGGQGDQDDKDNGGGQGPGGKKDDDKETASMSLEDALAEIKKLRKENASRRTASKSQEGEKKQMDEILGKVKQALGIENADEKPEVIASKLKDQNSALELELGIRDLAIEHQIPAEHLKYFGFLFRERLASLEEGEELDDDGMTEIVGQVKGLGTKTPAKTGATPPKDGKKPDAEGAGEPDAEKFSKMSIPEKTALHAKNPALYERLFGEAKQKRLL
jgi:hypothetical protein